MHCHGVGASANEMTVLPTRSVQRKSGMGLRLRRKKPLRLHTSAKCGSSRPPRSARSKLRMRPPSEISMLPSRTASTVLFP
jgi:hypothetical protein